MNHYPPILYRGSVKNVRGEVSASKLLFEFSDRYSIFDWGEMPDQLEGKGEALASMGKAFFYYLENSNNWINLFNSEIILRTFDHDYLSELQQSALYKRYALVGLNHHAYLNKSIAPNIIEVKNINVSRPLMTENNYCYDFYQSRPIDTLVPLEVIFRLGLAPENSYSKRTGIKESQAILKKPIIDFSTKLEKVDRYLSHDEAQKIAGLNDHEMNELITMAHLIGLNLFLLNSKLGLELWDGKIEVGFTQSAGINRSFVLVDSIGIDELRLIYKGINFSKEFLRKSYKETDWYKTLVISKEEALKTKEDFKKICIEKYHEQPKRLAPEIKKRAEAVYKIYANEINLALGLTCPFSADYSLISYGERYL